MSTRTQQLAELEGILEYSKETGVLHFKTRRAQMKAGDVAGSIDNHGYIKLQYCGKFFKAHRVIWFMVYGEEPDGLIDHINGVRSDNRIDNLRVVTNKQNLENSKARADNTTGFRGVSLNKRTGRYEAHIKHCGKKLNLGLFKSKEEANIAACNARDEFFTHALENPHG